MCCILPLKPYKILTPTHKFLCHNYLPASHYSDFISIMQTLLDSSDLLRWLNHDSKGPKFSASSTKFDRVT